MTWSKSGRKCGMSEKSNFFRVFVDTNVLISAMTSKASVSRKALLLLSEEHQLIICSYSIEEVSRALSKKRLFSDQQISNYVTL
jgi:predicted nucleic acid-binding protein